MPHIFASFLGLPVLVRFPNLRGAVISIASTPNPTAVYSGDMDGRGGGGGVLDYLEQ